MRNKTFLLLACLFCIGLLASCDVDFDANDDWHETMLVYGVLDQDNDTNFIRIEKCFLGKGNYVNFSKVKDSLYYKENDLEVSMYGFYTWDTSGWDTTKAQEKYYLNYTTHYKDNGSFYADNECPMYFTTKRLYPELYYFLRIKNKKTGIIVSAKTPLIANYSITEPAGERLSFTLNSSVNDNTSIIKWYNFNTNSKGAVAVCFQPVIKFNFYKDGKDTSLDIPFNYITQTAVSDQKELSYLIYRSTLISKIQTYKSNNSSATLTYNNTNPFSLYVYACTKEMKTYIDNNTPNESLTERTLYTNVNNGIGIFAARRLHIKKTFSSCDHDTQEENT